MKKYLIFLNLVFLATCLLAEKPLSGTTVKPYANLQFWNLYSSGFKVDGDELPDRIGSYFRRGRIGMKGSMGNQLTFDVMLSFDYLGKQQNLSSKGKPNKNTLSLWSAYFTYQPLTNSQWLMLTGGTFLPHLSRESATSPWSTSSLDKGETSCYLREFVIGKTDGICPGINIGGLGQVGKCQLLYNVSMISRQDYSDFANTDWTPLLLGHAVLVLGDKEWSSYKYILSGNPLKKRKSLSIGLGGSSQGNTDAYLSSSTLGADFLLMLNHLKIDGDYYWLTRESNSKYIATCSLLRASYNIFLKNEWVIEPAFMLCDFRGDDGWQDASFYDGEDQIIDSGVNLITPGHKIKFNIHYINRSGEATKNHRVTSSGTYGNYLNLGIQFKI